MFVYTPLSELKTKETRRNEEKIKDKNVECEKCVLEVTQHWQLIILINHKKNKQKKTPEAHRFNFPENRWLKKGIE